MIRNDFLEKLEELALVKKQCQIIFRDGGGKITVGTSIEGVYDDGGCGVLRLQSGQDIPLENLISVDGTTVENWS